MPGKKDALRAASRGESERAAAYNRISELRGIDELRPNPDQARRHFDEEKLDELAQSIRRHGIINPITIAADGTIIAGERRWRAAKLAGLDMVPVMVLRDREAWEVALAENVQREDIHPLDLAFRLDATRGGLGLTHEAIAARVGKSRVWVSELLGLLRLDERIQAECRARDNIDKKLLIRLSKMDEVTQHRAWDRLVAGERTSAAPRRKDGGEKRLSPRTVLPRVQKLRATFSRTDPAGWREKSRETLRDELRGMLSEITALLERLEEKEKDGE